jgi:site-specific DNA-methyltransferase (adenine-specific)
MRRLTRQWRGLSQRRGTRISKRLLGGLELNRIYQRDCIDGMRMIPDKSIDMILCDLPYGTTQNKWDSIIPLEPLWEQYERIIKDNGAIVLTASQPFTSLLVASNLRYFRYEWIWRKNYATGHLNAKRMPLKEHESIVVFYKRPPLYNAQGIVPYGKVTRRGHNGGNYGHSGVENLQEYTNYPRSVIECSSDKEKHHPTQKPVELFRYLLRTYTNPGEIVLDNCMGSGTTAVAATLEGRDWTGFETEPKYVEAANMRLDSLELPSANA